MTKRTALFTIGLTTMVTLGLMALGAAPPAQAIEETQRLSPVTRAAKTARLAEVLEPGPSYLAHEPSPPLLDLRPGRAGQHSEQRSDSPPSIDPALPGQHLLSASAAAYRAKRPHKVGVPKNYVYCKTFTAARCKPRTLHDYCSYSPDRFGKADFRGPCARHDMSIDMIRKMKVSVSKKRSKRHAADALFYRDLKQNCAYAHYNNGVKRTACNAAATGYLQAVNTKTIFWNGR